MKTVKPLIYSIIPARGGSKGLFRKNIRTLAGIPLIAHTIKASLGCNLIDRCFVSTEDSEIQKISIEWGAEVIDRPQELATDLSLTRDTVKHALNQMLLCGILPEYFVLLQPTSPLRTSTHLTEFIRLFLNSDALSAVSVTEMEHHPYKTFYLNNNNELTPFSDPEYLEAPRQILPSVYRPNGAMYIMSSKTFMEKSTFFVWPIIPYIMTSEESIDIDNECDLLMAENYIKVSSL
jgi:CMP-N-acetylneuraminic acid synthetase